MRVVNRSRSGSLMRRCAVLLTMVIGLSHASWAAEAGELVLTSDNRMAWFREAKFGLFFHWGYKSFDTNWTPAATLFRNLVDILRSAGRIKVRVDETTVTTTVVPDGSVSLRQVDLATIEIKTAAETTLELTPDAAGWHGFEL